LKVVQRLSIKFASITAVKRESAAQNNAGQNYATETGTAQVGAWPFKISESHQI